MNTFNIAKIGGQPDSFRTEFFDSGLIPVDEIDCQPPQICRGLELVLIVVNSYLDINSITQA